MEQTHPLSHLSDEDLHMGSEYVDARRYLAQRARQTHAPHAPSDRDPQHGSNDSDFGMPDQKQD